MNILPGNPALKWISTSVLALGLTACGGGGSSAPDTTAPTVSTTTPANNASSVARSSDLTATFDEDMFATTVDGSSFTLANAGAGNITGTVTFDGATNIATFSPDSPLAVLARYTATLTTAITDLSGNGLASDYNWSFITADGNWGTAELIETDNAGNAWDPQIAVDGSGNALAVWRQDDGARWNIWANRFDGSSWGTAELIETDNTGNAWQPQIAVDASGNALAVWYQDDGTRNNIWANRFDGSSWGSAELIETDNAGDAWRPQIAIDSSGNALAVWYQYDGTRYNIVANRFDGSSWGSAELIETDNAGGAWRPQIAFDANGNALAVWFQDDGTRLNIMANRFDGSSWGTAELIETDNTGSAREPQIALDASGNALAVWYQHDGISYSIWANRFDGSGWGTAELIETDNVGDAWRPQIAVDASGNALAVWYQHDGTRFNIWANRFDGVTWGTAELIETDNAGINALSSQIAIDANGNALAVWGQSDGSRGNIWANRFE